MLFCHDNAIKIIDRVLPCITAGKSISEKLSLLMQTADAQPQTNYNDLFTGSQAFSANPEVTLTDLRADLAYR